MNKQKKIIQVICLILAGLMVLGAATVIISVLASAGGHVH